MGNSSRYLTCRQEESKIKMSSGLFITRHVSKPEVPFRHGVLYAASMTTTPRVIAPVQCSWRPRMLFPGQDCKTRLSCLRSWSCRILGSKPPWCRPRRCLGCSCKNLGRSLQMQTAGQQCKYMFLQAYQHRSKNAGVNGRCTKTLESNIQDLLKAVIIDN